MIDKVSFVVAFIALASTIMYYDYMLTEQYPKDVAEFNWFCVLSPLSLKVYKFLFQNINFEFVAVICSEKVASNIIFKWLCTMSVDENLNTQDSPSRLQN